ncbi:tetratricopeptide repeat protein [Holophaga foetida]|uniref:tetratricopeptide repeat protein n=1 Tax=Holophaga foetida TaxID=35839 RepID=UPI0002471C3C|nr:tetratricopeptide repeat protein [Holophaga foetida]
MSRFSPFILSAVACLSLGADPAGRISGKAVDAAGKPIPSGNTATIQLSGAELFNQAVALYNDRKYAEALPLIEAAYKSLKTSCESLPAEKRPELEAQVAQVERVLGITLFEVGRQREAEPHFKAALVRNAKDQRVLDCLISLSKAKGDNASASAYQAALDALAGPRPDLAYNQGIDAYNKGDLAGAKPFFQQAIQADTSFAEAYYMLAMCEFAENNLKATKRNFMKYLEVAPKGKRAEEVKAMLGDPSLKGVK